MANGGGDGCGGVRPCGHAFMYVYMLACLIVCVCGGGGGGRYVSVCARTRVAFMCASMVQLICLLFMIALMALPRNEC